jgi:nucleoside-diphosphate-sugar epimerase
MYLVTGGSGFIGAAVVAELVKAGRECVVFSRSGNAARLGAVAGKIVVANGDVTDAGRLRQILAAYPIDAIIHLAFFTDIGRLETDPKSGANVNVDGFLNILEAARDAGLRRVVWTSSAAVYGGNGQYGGGPIKEEDPCLPLNIYGAYKSFCESLAEHYHNKLGVANISLRQTIVFGSGRWFRGAATYAYDLFHAPAAGKAVTVECGDQLVDWLYAKDLARAVVLACEADGLVHRVFNICGQRALVREAAAIMAGLCPAAPIDVLPGKRPTWGPVLNSERAEKELGYRPAYRLPEAFRECVEELQDSGASGT